MSILFRACYQTYFITNTRYSRNYLRTHALITLSYTITQVSRKIDVFKNLRRSVNGLGLKSPLVK